MTWVRLRRKEKGGMRWNNVGFPRGHCFLVKMILKDSIYQGEGVTWVRLKRKRGEEEDLQKATAYNAGFPVGHFVVVIG